MIRASLLLCILFVGVTANAQDVSVDKKIGAENAIMVEQEYGLYKHDSLNNLVNAIGNKLVSRLKSNPFEFKFFIADSHEPNAFALPGGYVYVTRGILALVQTEDELAGIMAHEIIHVTQRHSIKQAKKGVFTSVLKVPGNLVNAVTGTQIGNIINAPIDLSTKAFIAKYSRGHESESDAFGIQLAASAGYRTDALADALDRLTREVALLTGEDERRNYFSDHPYTPNRVSAIRKSAPLYKPVNPAPISKSDGAFIKNFNGLCFGDNPQQGLFVDGVFLHPDLGFAWNVNDTWQTMNKPTMAAAFSEKDDAVVALKVADPKLNPKELAAKAKEESQKNKSLTVLAAKDTVVNSFPAYVLRFKIEDQEGVAVVDLAWVRYSTQLTFQLLGISAPEKNKLIHESLYSFRKATQEELTRVNLLEMKIVHAQADETIEKISARTGNRLKPDFTAVINNHDVKKSLTAGAPLKIVTATPYLPKR